MTCAPGWRTPQMPEPMTVKLGNGVTVDYVGGNRVFVSNPGTLSGADLSSEHDWIIRGIVPLMQEVSRLKAWQDEAVAVESSWDAQAVAKLLGVPLGGDIRKAIQPAIERLKAEAEKVRAELTGGTEAVDELIQSMHELAEHPDTDERIIGACHARAAMFRGQEAALLARQDAPLGVCKTCDGSGWDRNVRQVFRGRETMEFGPCKTCGGTGKAEEDASL